jgi:hypothetical protein
VTDEQQTEQEEATEQDENGQPQGEEKSEEDMSASEKAQREEEQREEAQETMKRFEEEGPPDNIEDWPTDKAKYETFGGSEGDHSYAEGPEEEHLGPSSLRHHEDGRVSIAGDEVDDPDEYKSDPIPGGPTDESTGDAPGEDSDSDEDSDSESDDKEEAEA